MNEKEIYEQLDKINNSLDDLAREIDEEQGIIEPKKEEIPVEVAPVEVSTTMDTVSTFEANPITDVEVANEVIDLGTVSNEEKMSDFDLTKEIISNEISMPEVSSKELNEDLAKTEKGSKGQVILIIILSVVLVGLLASMIYFVNTL